MRPRSILVLVLASAAVVIQSGSATALGVDAAWGEVPSPNRGTNANELAGLTVLGPGDIWAVGRYNSGRPPTATGRNTLAMHWDGSAWTVTPTPNPRWEGADFFTLQDAVGVSTSNVWAVGYIEDFASLKSTTLIERWNGSRWTVVPSPNPGGQNLPNRLEAVDALDTGEAWAVGGAGFPEHALSLHWTGTRWRQVRNGCGVALNGLDIRTSGDIWAVGEDTTCHYDGTSWAIIPSPQPRPQYSEIAYVLQDVTVLAANDAWAAGYRVIDQGEYITDQSIVEHWNGSSWTLETVVPGQSLNGIVALSATDVWAVGTDGIRGMVVHFDGTGWSSVPSPSPGDSGVLSAVDEESPGHLWADGTSLGTTLVLESPSRFEGTVTGHTNVSGATVSWFGPESGSTATDPFGDYAVAGLSAGSYQLIESYPGCTPTLATVEVTAGQTVTKDLQMQC